jgi:hypothetical protein
MVVDAEARSRCGGREWKSLDLRRDPASAGDAGSAPCRDA